MIRRKAKTEPQVILDNGNLDLVLLDYMAYERLMMRIQELEDQLEGLVVSERITEFDKDPSVGIPFEEAEQMLGYKK
jgi:PHD/YefM family antitoxin component YafN of YafNO toxin-antitoxin module